MLESGRQVEFTLPAIPGLAFHAGGRLAQLTLAGDTDADSYCRLESLCDQLAADRALRTVLLTLNVSSAAWGISKAVRAIQRLRQDKFVAAWIGDAFGLSYQLAAACHAVWCSPVSRVGYFSVRVVPEFEHDYGPGTASNLTTAFGSDVEALRPRADMAALEYLADRPMFGEQAERAGLVDSCDADSPEALLAILLKNTRSIEQL